MIAYMLLNDWILSAIILVLFIVVALVCFFSGLSLGYTDAWATAKLNRWLDGTFVECNDGQYRSLSTVQENMGTNELCNAYNRKYKNEKEYCDAFRRIAEAYALSFKEGI